MGQEIRGVPEAAALSDEADADAQAIGAYLARQRRLRDISLEDLAARTKIPRRSLARLESGAFDRASDGFSRGFVRAVATALGLDADDAVARLLREPAGEGEPAERGLPRLRGSLGRGIAALLGAALLGLALWGAGRLWPSAEPAPPDPDLSYRRDAVRELAEAVADGDAVADGEAPAPAGGPPREPSAPPEGP
jgi:transcriptional regulator with XRE-family HTH domain